MFTKSHSKKIQNIFKMSQKVMATGTITTLSTSKRRISPRTMLKCSSERAKRAKLISKSLFGSPSRSELKE